jgi:hypothetical protein
MRLAAVGTLALALLAAAGCGGSGSAAPTRKEYLAEVDAVCRDYGRKLARVPPPSSFDNLADVALLRDSAARGARETSKQALLAFFQAREAARRSADRLGITC